MRSIRCLPVWVLLLPVMMMGVETGQFRLLSVTEAGKLILVSKIPDKTKYLLDASTAKITLDGKPAEFEDLKHYSVISVKFTIRKSKKDDVNVDGVASEIKITRPGNTALPQPVPPPADSPR